MLGVASPGLPAPSPASRRPQADPSASPTSPRVFPGAEARCRLRGSSAPQLPAAGEARRGERHLSGADRPSSVHPGGASPVTPQEGADRLLPWPPPCTSSSASPQASLPPTRGTRGTCAFFQGQVGHSQPLTSGDLRGVADWEEEKEAFFLLKNQVFYTYQGPLKSSWKN